MYLFLKTSITDGFEIARAGILLQVNDYQVHLGNEGRGRGNGRL
jgi:hypothetical protein